MNIKDYIQDNPFRVMGVFTNDSASVLSSNHSRMKAFAAIGKDVAFLQDMEAYLTVSPAVIPMRLPPASQPSVRPKAACAMDCSGS